MVGRSDGKAFGRAIDSITFGGTSTGTGKGKGVATGSVSFGGSIIPKTSNSVVRGPKLRAVSSETDYARSGARFGGFDMASEGGAPIINIFLQVFVLDTSYGMAESCHSSTKKNSHGSKGS